MGAFVCRTWLTNKLSARPRTSTGARLRPKLDRHDRSIDASSLRLVLHGQRHTLIRMNHFPARGMRGQAPPIAASRRQLPHIAFARSYVFRGERLSGHDLRARGLQYEEWNGAQAKVASRRNGLFS